MGDNMSPADIKAVLGDNNGTTIAYPYMGGFGNSGFGNGDWSWIIILLILCGGFGGYGFGGGFGGFGMGMDFMYPWLSNGQKEIMQNTNQGFDTLQLSNQIESSRDAIHGISNQICSSTSDITGAITNGLYGAEISANNRQMADMQQNFELSRQLSQCCCDNRLATCQTQNIVQNEANTTRFADANNTRDIITNATQNTQAILDKLCQLELDGVKAQVEAKNDKIQDLQRELQMADLRASQIAQTANIVDMTYTRLRDCPIESTPIYRKNSDIHLQQ